MVNLRKATASGRRELPYLGLLDVSRALRSGRLTATEVTQVLLDRIAELDPVLRSYTTVTASRAMARAAQADAELGKGLWRGPLHGVPIAVKDLCRSSYAPTAAGMAIHRDAAPSTDCTVVARLEQAGAVMLGKLTMTEGAFSGHHPAMPTPINPFSPGTWTGASSSGSGVATAAGLCFASLGSDTGGSIRFPSAACGLTGLKPTWGRVSRHGVFALADSLDHIGPMTRSAEDAAAVLGVIAGADPHDPTALQAPVPDYLAGLGGGIRGMRIGLDESFAFDGLDGDVAKSLRLAIEALAHLGARLVPIKFPPIEAVLQAFTPLCSVECAIAHEATYPGRASEYGPQLAAWIETGRKVSAAELGKAMQQRLVFCGQVAEVFGSLDAIVAPVMPTTIPSLERWSVIADSDGTDADFSGVLRFTSPFDMTGSPTLTLPGDPDRAGVPIGFQLIGPHLSETALLRAGHALQQITDWHTRRPDLAAHTRTSALAA